MKCSQVLRTTGAALVTAVVLLALTPSLNAATLYVDVNNTTPSSPYTNWSSAAVTIQAAVDAAAAGDEIVVTNGIYQTGGRVVFGAMTNRVAVTRVVTVRSVNGPQATIIQGYQHLTTTNGNTAVRCVYLTNGAALIGFTLTNGATRATGDTLREESGGGVWCASASDLVSNCVLTGNSAYYHGGGAFSNTLVDCTLNGNTARSYGGGAYSATLTNCTLRSNRASSGGGAYQAALASCIIVSNTANSGGGAYSGALKSCSLLSNSATSGGGAYSTTLTNCTLAGNFASSFGGGAYSSTLNACALTNNSAADDGAGVYLGSLTNCVLAGNVAADDGGGAYQATLVQCTLTNNVASPTGGGGGGAIYGMLNNCTVAGNSAAYGGGTYGSTLNNCILTNNSASYGGGVSGSANVNNCLVADNSASEGGAAWGSGCKLVNCTVVRNSASHCGGTVGGSLTNCILYYNRSSSEANYSGSRLCYCCTTPLPVGGLGNIEADPQLADVAHLSAGSPCRGAGSAAYAKGKDIDGDVWATPPSIGCDEFYAGLGTGLLAVSLSASFTNVAVGFSVDLISWTSGRATASGWGFGDGTVISNRPYASHAWSTPGDYAVVLWVCNDSNPGGISSTVMVHVAAQQIHYVALTSPAPLAPFTTWDTAATNIQDAVDAATLPGALVLVSNGVYASRARVAAGALSNRVAVTKPVVVQSLNGPGATVIQGFQVPGTTNGDGAVRCVYLRSGATLSGFTLANGATRATGDGGQEQIGGGVWCEPTSTATSVSNCWLVGNCGCNGGGGGAYGRFVNCTVSGNSVLNGAGGGIFCAGVDNCTLTGNSAYNGGGAYLSTLNNCILVSNSAPHFGGGVAYGVLNACTLSSNSAASLGGGAWDATLSGCTLRGNFSASDGGGASGCTILNSELTGNSAWRYGGGADSCTLNNCTVTGNSAVSQGGGANSGTLNNCILYYNSAALLPNYAGSNLNYCCTTPLPGSGVGNTDAEPQLASTSHLSTSSPCRGAGDGDYARGTDIDDEPWANPPSLGCDELYAGAATGGLSVSIEAAHTTIAAGFSLDLAAGIAGRVTGSRWEFGDGMMLSNRPYASHAWSNPGDYTVRLWAFSDSYAAGIAATQVVHVISQPMHYVALDSTAPASPYTSWATAATNIQDAVDAATVPGALVLISNGVYRVGARAVYGALSNRVAVTMPLVLQGFNGPGPTVIQGSRVPSTTNGDGAVRCVYLASGGVLQGVTLAGGATRAAGDGFQEQSGGGVWCASTSATISNCVLTGNSAFAAGGGASVGTLVDCVLSGNAASMGGGASWGSLVNCTLTSNSASLYGGGACSNALSLQISHAGTKGTVITSLNFLEVVWTLGFAKLQ